MMYGGIYRNINRKKLIYLKKLVLFKFYKNVLTIKIDSLKFEHT